MAGTKAGGKAAAKTNKEKYDAIYIAKYGMTFYEYQGRKGGKTPTDKLKGFATMSESRLREISIKGGRKSRRG